MTGKQKQTKGKRSQSKRKVVKLQIANARYGRTKPSKGSMQVVRQQFTNVEDKLTRMFLLPSEGHPMRMPSDPPRLTAIWAFQQIKSDSVTSGGAAYLVYKDPAYPLWKSFKGSITGGLKQTYIFDSSTVLGKFYMPQVVGESVTVRVNSRDTPVGTGTWGSPTSAITALGVRAELVTAMSPNSPDLWWFVPNPALTVVQFVTPTGAVLTGGAWQLTLEVTGDPTTSNARAVVYDVAVSASNANIVEMKTDMITSDPGWWRVVSLQCTTAPTTAFTDCVIDSVTVGWLSAGTPGTPTAVTMDGFYPATVIGGPEYGVAPSVYEMCRLNAGSFLFQNVTAAVNKEGSVRAGVINAVGNDSFANIITMDSYLTDVTPSMVYEGLLEKGLYTFMQPSMSSTAFGDSIASTTGGNGPAQFRLDCHQQFYYITMSPTAATQTLQITYVCHHEAINTSMLYQTGMSNLPYENYRQVMIGTAQMLPFVENPIHWAAMALAAKRVAKRAWEYVRPHLNPLGHKAVDYLIPRYRELAIKDKQASPYA